MTFAEYTRDAARRLSAGGASAESARIDADVLARHALGWDAAHWLTHQREPVTDVFRADFDAIIRRRLQHEPVAYITGLREFYGRPFAVRAGALIPRPETELVVELALVALDEIDRRLKRSPTVVDVGTGSGCIAVTLALEYPRATVVATDISFEALAVARDNAARLGAANRVHFAQGSILAGIEQADLIAANPPYIGERERPTLQSDVVDYEPSAALFGGTDGLDIIRALARDASRALTPGGWLIFEFGNGQEPDILDLLAAETPTLAVIRVAPDLAGIPRVLVAQNAGASV